MATCRYVVLSKLTNACVMAALCTGTKGMHKSCNSVDTALAMTATMEAVQRDAATLTDMNYNDQHLL